MLLNQCNKEKKYRLKETNNKDFWEPILSSKQFKDAVYNKYAISSKAIMGDESEELNIDEEFESSEEEANE